MDPAHIDGRSAHRRVLARHRAVAHDDPSLGDAIADPLAGITRNGVDAEPDRHTTGGCPGSLCQIGAVFEDDVRTKVPKLPRYIVAAHDIDRAHATRLRQNDHMPPDRGIGDGLYHPIS